jgi:hypothetical protein
LAGSVVVEVVAVAVVVVVGSVAACWERSGIVGLLTIGDQHNLESKQKKNIFLPSRTNFITISRAAFSSVDLYRYAAVQS